MSSTVSEKIVKSDLIHKAIYVGIIMLSAACLVYSSNMDPSPEDGYVLEPRATDNNHKEK